MKKAKILDSYAILSLLQNETGADKVTELLEKASNDEEKLYMNWINVGEVYYQIIRREGKKIADETLTELRLLPITFVSVTDELVLSAAEAPPAAGSAGPRGRRFYHPERNNRQTPYSKTAAKMPPPTIIHGKAPRRDGS